jgi:hypothetical protein
MADILAGKPQGVECEARNVHDPDNYTVSWPTGRHRWLRNQLSKLRLQEQWFTKGREMGKDMEPSWSWRDVEIVDEEGL